MGRAIRLLGRRGLAERERDEHVASLNAELEQWEALTPAFFHPRSTKSPSPELDSNFITVPNFFRRLVIPC